ncbi:MAG: hypothetical protein Q6365_017035 [Candidatus Sigynarchaeota archaeon]
MRKKPGTFKSCGVLRSSPRSRPSMRSSWTGWIGQYEKPRKRALQKFRAARSLINHEAIPTPMAMENTWKAREPAIAALAPDLLRALIVLEARPPVSVRVFFCEGVMAVVRYLREATTGTEPGAMHHVFKILAKHAMYGERGRMEVASRGERMDIYFDETMASISVKTIINATIEAIRGKTMAIFDATPADQTWIFFFYKFKGRASPRPPCQYLITWVDIASLDLDVPGALVRQVIAMVTKAKEKAAKQLGVPGKILIPVPDIIKVEDLEREIEEKDKIIADKDKALVEKDRVMDALARENAELKKRLGLK